MAGSALDILSLTDAKLQLRIDADDHDSLVTSAINSAVNYVQHLTGVPLVDADEIFDIYQSSKDQPMSLPTIDVKSIGSIKYWTPTQQLREEPSGSIDGDAISTLGRKNEIRMAFGSRTEIWPPEDGWPDSLSGTKFRVTAKIGFDIDAQSESLRQAVILMTRHFFEAPERIESDFAVVSLLQPWQRYG